MTTKPTGNMPCICHTWCITYFQTSSNQVFYWLSHNLYTNISNSFHYNENKIIIFSCKMKTLQFYTEWNWIGFFFPVAHSSMNYCALLRIWINWKLCCKQFKHFFHSQFTHLKCLMWRKKCFVHTIFLLLFILFILLVASSLCIQS